MLGPGQERTKVRSNGDNLFSPYSRTWAKRRWTDFCDHVMSLKIHTTKIFFAFKVFFGQSNQALY